MMTLKEDDASPVRLNRFLAECGLGARRKVEDLIHSGRVSIDGRNATEPGIKVLPGQVVALDGSPLARTRKIYLLLYKPAGIISAVTDRREKTVIDLLGVRFRNLGLFPVGRLDKESEGLLILTNDGSLAHLLTHPSKGVIKRYDLCLDRRPSLQDLENFAKGAEVEGKWVKPVSVGRLEGPGYGEWIRVFLREGRKRELRVMAETHGFRVKRLIRTAIGGLEDIGLRSGEFREFSLKKLTELIGIGEKE